MSRAGCHLVGILSFVGTPSVWTCATTLVRILTFTQSTLHKVTEPIIFFQTFSTCGPASGGNIDICNFSVWLSVSSWLIIYKIRSMWSVNASWTSLCILAFWRTWTPGQPSSRSIVPLSLKWWQGRLWQSVFCGECSIRAWVAKQYFVKGSK